VAAAKVRRAQDSVMATRPFSETLQSVFGGLINRLGGEAADLPLLTQREVNKVTIVVITGDRGLCGGYNSFMIKKAEARILELEAQGIKSDLILIGNKGRAYFNRRPYPIRKEFECSQNPDSKQALAISEEIINSFLSGETDAVELLYTKFVSLIASTPSVRTLVPFSASEISQKGDEVFQLTSSGGDFGVERKELDVAARAGYTAELLDASMCRALLGTPDMLGLNSKNCCSYGRPPVQNKPAPILRDGIWALASRYKRNAPRATNAQAHLEEREDRKHCGVSGEPHPAACNRQQRNASSAA